MNNEESTYNLDVNAALSRMYAAEEGMRPTLIYKPRIYPDGDQWCALLGVNLQEGVCGFGETPDAACREFDLAWHQNRLRPAKAPPTSDKGAS